MYSVRLCSLVALLFGIATSNLLINGGFEDGPCTTTCCVCLGVNSLPGWTVILGDIDIDPRPFGVPPDSGSFSIDLNGYSQGAISQTFATTPGFIYEVTWSFTGGCDLLRNANVSVGNVAQNFAIPCPFDVSNWQRGSLLFTAQGATSTLQFMSNNGGAGGIILDTISVDLVGPVTSGVLAPATTGAVNAPLLCSGYAAAGAFSGQGYFCNPYSTGFVQCLDGAFNSISATFACPPGTVCKCAAGTECGASGSPCDYP